ncbi:MAG: PAS domain S-box protein [Enhydrobacter sp.]|nr:MAG: PAS domain S-box protein [Enhydrobacter sp.]
MSNLAISPASASKREGKPPLRWLGRTWLAGISRRQRALAAAAALLGLVCIAAGVHTLVTSQHLADVERDRVQEARVIVLERATYRLLRAALEPAPRARVAATWRDLREALPGICPTIDQSVPGIVALDRACAAGSDLGSRVEAAVAAYDPPRASFDPVVLRELMVLHNAVVGWRELAFERANLLEDRLVRDYDNAMIVLAASTTGFTAVALALLALFGRASIRQTHKAEEAAAAAAAARESRDLLQEVVDGLPGGVVVYDRDERLMLANALAGEVTPMLNRPEVRGWTYEQIVRAATEAPEASAMNVSPADVPAWVARFRNDTPYAHRFADGRWFEWSGRTTPSGKKVGLRVEVTRAKEQEQLLEAARERYRLLVESLSDMVYALDVQGRFLYASPAAATLLGVPPSLLLGRSYFDFVPDEDREASKEEGRLFYRNAGTETIERTLRIRSVQGEVRQVEVRYRRPARRESDGAVLIGIMRDVSRELELTQRLAQERERLRSIVDSSGVLILMVDRDLKVEMANKEFWRARGRVAEEWIGRPLAELMDFSFDRETYERWCAGPLGEEQAQPLRYSKSYTHPGGRRRVINITATPVLDEQRRMQQIVFVAIDDTERRDAEQALFDADRLATLGEMAATVAHELRQPLQVIALACGAALDELQDPDYVAQKLTRIDNQVERANRIIEDLRLYARGTSGEGMVVFDVATSIRAAVDLTAGRLRRVNTRVGLELPPGLARVRGHPARLEQVLVNLINNACDAGGHALFLSAGLETRDDRRFVRIVLTDDGPGIPDQVLPRLFTSFVTTKTSGKGTGLGLRICRRLVEEMGGTIAGANRPEGGAAFTVLLPAAADR